MKFTFLASLFYLPECYNQHVFCIAFLFCGINLSGQTLSTKNVERRAIIDSVFNRSEAQGFNTNETLKYIYHFSDKERTPLVELGKELEEDTIEVISIYQEGDKWKLSAFRNEILSRKSMHEREGLLRWLIWKYKVDDYNGFTISRADIDFSAIAEYEFYPYLLSLDNNDLYNVAMRLDKLKLYPKAMIAFQELINRDFKPDTAYYKMGTALVGTHEYVKGIEHWERVTTFNPNYLEVYMNLGQIFFENSHWKKAYANFKEAHRIKPNDDVILYHLAKSLIKLERYNEAFITIKRAVRLNPKNQYSKGVLKSLKSPAIRKLRKKFPLK